MFESTNAMWGSGPAVALLLGDVLIMLIGDRWVVREKSAFARYSAWFMVAFASGGVAAYYWFALVYGGPSTSSSCAMAAVAALQVPVLAQPWLGASRRPIRVCSILLVVLLLAGYLWLGETQLPG